MATGPSADGGSERQTFTPCRAVKLPDGVSQATPATRYGRCHSARTFVEDRVATYSKRSRPNVFFRE